MAIDHQDKLRQKVLRGKYRPLYEQLCNSEQDVVQVSFAKLEELLGFALPIPARRSPEWWSNEPGGTAQNQAHSWRLAGKETSAVDFHEEWVVFRPISPGSPVLPFCVSQLLPPHDVGPWPEGLSLRRVDIYADRA